MRMGTGMGLSQRGGGGSVTHHVVLVAGQSNAIGRDAYDSGTTHPANVQEWDGSAVVDVLSGASGPLRHPDRNAGDMGLDISFAEDYMAENPAITLVFVPMAYGGTGFKSLDYIAPDFTSWHKGDTLHDDAVSAVNDCMTSLRGDGHTPLFVGIVWHLGESDALDGMSQNAFAAALDQMFIHMREGITDWSDDAWVLVGELEPNWVGVDAERVAINDAINAADAQTVDRIGVVSSDSLSSIGAGDPHFNAASLRTFGNRYYSAIATAQSTTAPLPAPGDYDANSETPPFVADATLGVYKVDGTQGRFEDAITLTRASKATYLDSSGVYTWAANDGRRTNHHIYNGSSWVGPTWAIGTDAVTNLLDKQNPPQSTSHTKTGCTMDEDVEDNNGVAFSRINVDATSDIHGVSRTNNSITSGNYTTVSWLIKDDGAGFCSISIYGTVNTLWAAAVFNATTGAVTHTETGGHAASPDIMDAGAVDLGGGVFRIYLSVKSNFSGNHYPTLNTNSGGTPTLGANGRETFTPTAGDDLLFSLGVRQVRAHMTLPPLNDTVKSHSADVVTIPAGNLPAAVVSGAIHGTETYSDTGTAGQITLFKREVDASNKLELFLDTDGANTGTFTLTLTEGGSATSVSTTGDITDGVNRSFAVAFRVDENSMNIALNGTAETQVATGSVPDLSLADVELNGNGTRDHIAFWDVSIGNAGLADASNAAIWPA